MEDVKITHEIYEYDATNISDNPFDLIDQDTESIMRDLEESNAAPED